MKLIHGLFNIVALIFIFAFMLIFRSIYVILEDNVDAYRLNYACKYSAEAAFVSILNSGTLGIDYRDLGKVSIKPYDSLNIFTETMCLNYDLSITDINKISIENNIPTGLLITRDGYYILEEDSKTHRLTWSLKRAYIEDKGAYENVVDIISNNYLKVDLGSQLSVTDLSNYSYQISKEWFLQNIVNKIQSDVNYQVNKRNLNKKDFVFYIPPVKDSLGVRGIDKPTLIMFLQGFKIDSFRELNSYTMYGYKVAKKKIIIGFVDQYGIKRYCYEGQVPQSLTRNIKEIFSSMIEANMKGYRPDYELLKSKIDIED